MSKSQAKIEIVLAQLKKSGIEASWEYPGFIRIEVPGKHTCLNFGQDNIWAFSLVAEDGTTLDLPESISHALPNDAPSAVLVYWIKVCYYAAQKEKL